MSDKDDRIAELEDAIREARLAGNRWSGTPDAAAKMAEKLNAVEVPSQPTLDDLTRKYLIGIMPKYQNPVREAFRAGFLAAEQQR